MGTKEAISAQTFQGLNGIQLWLACELQEIQFHCTVQYRAKYFSFGLLNIAV